MKIFGPENGASQNEALVRQAQRSLRGNGGKAGLKTLAADDPAAESKTYTAGHKKPIKASVAATTADVLWSDGGVPYCQIDASVDGVVYTTTTNFLKQSVELTKESLDKKDPNALQAVVPAFTVEGELSVKARANGDTYVVFVPKA